MIRLKKMNEKGVILLIAYGIITILLVIGMIFFSRSISEKNIAQRHKSSTYAFNAAEAGLDRVKQELFDTFGSFFNSAGGRTSAAFTWFDSLPDAAKYTFPSVVSLGNGTYTVDIYDADGNVDPAKFSVDTGTIGRRDVTLTVVGAVNGSTRTLRAVVRYELAPSPVFDYSYFVNNFGWFFGGGITSNGDIRSNGDFAFSGNPEVNGDIYASVNPGLGAAGDITGSNKNDTVSQYRSQASDRARPSDPTADPEDTNGNGALDAGEDVNGNGILDDFDYPDGYDGQSDRFPQQELLEMPYLGDLQTYKDLAAAKNGTVSQGGSTLVDNVLTGNVVLIGTAANPIVINGPVVVTGDVLIKGVVTGQGTIYAGRNTHILSEITYLYTNDWIKPDTDPDATDTFNADRDFLGLATKGNVVIGDYTRTDWQTNITGYIEPPFTQAYEVDSTDVVNGYDSYYVDGDPYFDGDYTANDGGTKDDGSGRKFYESSYNDTYISSVADSSSSIRRIDAVTYTNHLFTGKVGAFTMNGAIISRDEAVVFSGSIEINYDLRAKTMGENFYLPRSLALPQTIVLEE